MKTPIVEIVEYEGNQLKIDFDLDKPQYSICPKCSSQIIKLSSGCKACGWSESEKMQGDKLSIPCEIRWPNQSPLDALIVGETPSGVEGRGDQFDILIKDDPVLADQVIPIAKIYVFPKLPSLPVEKKCRTTPDLSPCKKSRRKRGKGSGYIEYRPVKRGTKTYKQAWLNYEIWQDGDRVTKSSKYIPKKLEAKIIRMNSEKAPIKKLLKVLNSKSQSKRR